MNYMKNHFQREFLWMFLGPWSLILLAMMLVGISHTPLGDLLFASLAGIVFGIVVNVLTKVFYRAVAFSAILVFICVTIFRDSFASSAITVSICSLPACLLTAWIFSKARQKRELVKDKG